MNNRLAASKMLLSYLDEEMIERLDKIAADPVGKGSNFSVASAVIAMSTASARRHLRPTTLPFYQYPDLALTIAQEMWGIYKEGIPYRDRESRGKTTIRFEFDDDAALTSDPVANARALHSALGDDTFGRIGLALSRSGFDLQVPEGLETLFANLSEHDQRLVKIWAATMTWSGSFLCAMIAMAGLDAPLDAIADELIGIVPFTLASGITKYERKMLRKIIERANQKKKTPRAIPKA